MVGWASDWGGPVSGETRYIEFNYKLHPYMIYRSVGKTTAKGLILSDLTVKINLILILHSVL
jgi:hypothetical protein